MALTENDNSPVMGKWQFFHSCRLRRDALMQAASGYVMHDSDGKNIQVLVGFFLYQPDRWQGSVTSGRLKS